MTHAQTFFTQPGPMTDAGAMKSCFDNLPGSVAELCRVVQGVMLHVFWADQYGVNLAPERREEVQLRTVAARMARILELDSRPLSQARSPEQRVVGNCRDFSVLLTAVLRHQHIPARTRCGFGRYFLPNHFEDHWVAEYWHAAEARWVLVDAQLDDLQRQKLAIPFDPLDVPRDQFIVGGQAWQLCRSGAANPNDFGIHDMHGLWFVRGNLVRDVAALNNMELLPWDAWGLIEGRDEDLSADDYRLLDEAAALTCGDVPAWKRLRAMYEGDGRLHVPPVINSYTAAGPIPVTLPSLEMKGHR